MRRFPGKSHKVSAAPKDRSKAKDNRVGKEPAKGKKTTSVVAVKPVAKGIGKSEGRPLKPINKQSKLSIPPDVNSQQTMLSQAEIKPIISLDDLQRKQKAQQFLNPERGFPDDISTITPNSPHYLGSPQVKVSRGKKSFLTSPSLAAHNITALNTTGHNEADNSLLRTPDSTSGQPDSKKSDLDNSLLRTPESGTKASKTTDASFLRTPTSPPVPEINLNNASFLRTPPSPPTLLKNRNPGRTPPPVSSRSPQTEAVSLPKMDLSTTNEPQSPKHRSAADVSMLRTPPSPDVEQKHYQNPGAKPITIVTQNEPESPKKVGAVDLSILRTPPSPTTEQKPPVKSEIADLNNKHPSPKNVKAADLSIMRTPVSPKVDPKHHHSPVLNPLVLAVPQIESENTEAATVILEIADKEQAPVGEESTNVADDHVESLADISINELPPSLIPSTSEDKQYQTPAKTPEADIQMDVLPAQLVAAPTLQTEKSSEPVEIPIQQVESLNDEQQPNIMLETKSELQIQAAAEYSLEKASSPKERKSEVSTLASNLNQPRRNSYDAIVPAPQVQQEKQNPAKEKEKVVTKADIDGLEGGTKKELANYLFAKKTKKFYHSTKKHEAKEKAINHFLTLLLKEMDASKFEMLLNDMAYGCSQDSKDLRQHRTYSLFECFRDPSKTEQKLRRFHGSAYSSWRESKAEPKAPVKKTSFKVDFTDFDKKIAFLR